MSDSERNFLSRKTNLAIAAVVYIALSDEDSPVSSAAICTSYRVKPRYLEAVFQSFVHNGILRGVRGPKGGYQLGRDRNKIYISEIVRIVSSLSTIDNDELFASSEIIHDVVDPIIRESSLMFIASLDKITVGDLCKKAGKTAISQHRAGDRGEAECG